MRLLGLGENVLDFGGAAILSLYYNYNVDVIEWHVKIVEVIAPEGDGHPTASRSSAAKHDRDLL
jgi:hypothetical protein